jgi:hypothetical protein
MERQKLKKARFWRLNYYAETAYPAAHEQMVNLRAQSAHI